MSNIYNVDSYTPKKEDKFLFDTNVWMYLFCPVGNYQKFVIDKYSRFLVKILRAESQIYVTSHTISEFFNAYVKTEFRMKQEEDREKYKYFKRDFRNTAEYKEIAEGISGIIKSKILKRSKKIDDNFSNIDIVNILDVNDKYDFNDSYFVKLAADNGLKIVTNDRDFFDYDADITILTGWNKKYF